MTFSVYLMDEYDTQQKRVEFYDALRTRLGVLEGVVSVSGTSALPLSDGAPRAPVSIFRQEGQADPQSFFLTEGFSVLGGQLLPGIRGDGWALADLTAVQPGYFATIGASLVSGRSIGRSDGLGSPLTVVVDEGLAEHLWARTDPVGQRAWVAGACRWC